MTIHRHSPFFYTVLSLFTLALLFVAYASFSTEITLDTCRELGLPVLTVETEGAKKIKSKEKYLKASFVLIDERGEMTAGNCKIRGRGNTTWRTRELYKKPYLLKLNKSAPLLGFPAAEKWVLMANTADKTQLRNCYAEHLSHKLWNRFDWSPRSRFISLFLNGKYEGLYELTEKVEAVEGRLPIREDDGSFVAVVNSRLNKEFNFKSEHGVPFSIRTNGFADNAEFERRKSIIQTAENALFSDKGETAGNWRELLDEDSFIDWYLVNELTKNHDARFQSSCYLYYDAHKEKIFMGPPWDFDIAMGNISWDDCEKPEGWWISGASWYAELLKDADFCALVRARWHERRDPLSESLAWLQARAQSLKEAVMLNDAVWKNIGHRQWPHTPGWKSRKTYESEVHYMMNWLEARIEWLDGAFELVSQNKQDTDVK